MNNKDYYRDYKFKKEVETYLHQLFSMVFISSSVAALLVVADMVKDYTANPSAFAIVSVPITITIMGLLYDNFVNNK